jgi:hypothetical protein
MVLVMGTASYPIAHCASAIARSGSRLSKANGTYIKYTLGQKLEWPDSHVDKVEASDREVCQEHDKVPMVEVSYTVVDPWAMLVIVEVSATPWSKIHHVVLELSSSLHDRT